MGIKRKSGNLHQVKLPTESPIQNKQTQTTNQTAEVKPTTVPKEKDQYLQGAKAEGLIDNKNFTEQKVGAGGMLSFLTRDNKDVADIDRELSSLRMSIRYGRTIDVETIELRGMDFTSDLSAIVDNPKTPEKSRIEARLLRGVVACQLAKSNEAFEIAGADGPQVMTSKQLHMMGLEDLAASATEYKANNIGRNHNVSWTDKVVGEAIAADGVITPAERKLAQEMDQGIKSYAFDASLGIRAVSVPSPELQGQATAWNKRLQELIKPNITPQLEAREFLSELSTEYQKGGDKGLVAGQFMYKMLTRSIYNPPLINPKTVHFGGKKVEELGLKLCNKLEPDFLALHSNLPDETLLKTDWSKEPEKATALANKYLDGFQGDFPVEYHVSALEKIVDNVPGKAVGGLIDRFAQQAKSAVDADPSLRGAYATMLGRTDRCQMSDGNRAKIDELKSHFAVNSELEELDKTILEISYVKTDHLSGSQIQDVIDRLTTQVDTASAQDRPKAILMRSALLSHMAGPTFNEPAVKPWTMPDGKGGSRELSTDDLRKQALADLNEGAKSLNSSSGAAQEDIKKYLFIAIDGDEMLSHEERQILSDHDIRAEWWATDIPKNGDLNKFVDWRRRWRKNMKFNEPSAPKRIALEKLAGELKAAWKAGGDDSVVASQMLFDLVRIEKLDEELLGDDTTYDVGKSVMENANAEHLTLRTMIPERMIDRAAKAGKIDDLVAFTEKYYEGFDNGITTSFYHTKMLKNILREGVPVEKQVEISKTYLEQAAKAAKEDPRLRKQYRHDIDNVLYFQKGDPEAMQLFKQALPYF